MRRNIRRKTAKVETLLDSADARTLLAKATPDILRIFDVVTKTAERFHLSFVDGTRPGDTVNIRALSASPARAPKSVGDIYFNAVFDVADIDKGRGSAGSKSIWLNVYSINEVTDGEETGSRGIPLRSYSGKSEDLCAAWDAIVKEVGDFCEHNRSVVCG
jgi:hypothetical protein